MMIQSVVKFSPSVTLKTKVKENYCLDIIFVIQSVFSLCKFHALNLMHVLLFMTQYLQRVTSRKENPREALSLLWVFGQTSDHLNLEERIIGRVSLLTHYNKKSFPQNDFLSQERFKLMKNIL